MFRYCTSQRDTLYLGIACLRGMYTLYLDIACLIGIYYAVLEIPPAELIPISNPDLQDLQSDIKFGAAVAVQTPPD